MHMANELLSIPVATGTLAIAAAGLGLVCRKARNIIASDKLALMGVLGAFVFAAQMVNFPLPAMPGTSGHMVGAVLLAVILGPHAAVIVMSSVVIVQCLIFQDGGLLALGCNLINMALVPTYLGYFLYKTVAACKSGTLQIYIGAILASVIALEAGALLVTIQAALSRVLVIPFSHFLITMLAVHLLVGFVEGLITVAILGYLQQVRPDIVLGRLPGKIRVSRNALLATLAVFTVITAAGLSLIASGLPDGLEWTYAERPDQPDFKPTVANEDSKVAAVDDFQSKYSPLPDYSLRTSKIGQSPRQGAEAAAAWTSFAGVLGSALVMVLIWLVSRLLRRSQSPKAQNIEPGDPTCTTPT
ncbi:MAG: energy-coupling factor ABC transporter permease [Planctomycetota bacterium]|jgi:cobalt/nickel transport system permease protein